MTKEELWKNWADPSNWAEYNEKVETLEKTKKRFFKDIDKYFIAEAMRIAEDTFGEKND